VLDLGVRGSGVRSEAVGHAVGYFDARSRVPVKDYGNPSVWVTLLGPLEVTSNRVAVPFLPE